jgi:ribosomal protein S12 methylthiotransferase accessory factor
MQIELISEAVDFLEEGCQDTVNEVKPAVLSLLADTGHIRTLEDRIEFSDHRKTGANVLKLLFKFKRFFPLPSHSAPGLFAFGGEVDIANASLGKIDGRLSSVSGASTTPGRGINSCLGEAAERLSQYQENPGLVRKGTGSCPDVLLKDGFENPGKSDLILGTNCASGEHVALLAQDCVFVAGSKEPTSTGCGAGLTLEDAVLHGMLELVERDAFALWWIAGRPGRPIDLSTKTLTVANACLRALRGDKSTRLTWLLDISGDVDLPCIAAVSANEQGFEVSVGTACHPKPERAVESALTEMCLMELSHQVAKMKAQTSSGKTLNPKDEMHLKRSQELDAKSCPLLHPQGIPKYYAPSSSEGDFGQSSKAVAELLQSVDISVYFADLTSTDLGVPVAKCVSPDLQTYPFSQPSARLEQHIEKYGGGSALSTGIMLY